MNYKKNEAGNLLPMIVTEGLTVTILPDSNHEFLMSTKEAAHGYGTSEYVIRQTKLRHSSELIEGKHFISNVTFSHGASTRAGSSRSTMWTKRGIVRLGFFIKSERASLFRDWAEELIICLDNQQTLFNQVTDVRKMLPKRTRANRLTPARMVDIMADVCRIEDTSLRLSLTDKLMGGR